MRAMPTPATMATAIAPMPIPTASPVLRPLSPRSLVKVVGAALSKVGAAGVVGDTGDTGRATGAGVVGAGIGAMVSAHSTKPCLVCV